MPAVAVKKSTDITKLNRKLLDENLTLKDTVADQLRLIEKLRAHKGKAHRRLKALRELNRAYQSLSRANDAHLLLLKERIRMDLQRTNPMKPRKWFDLFWWMR